MGNVGYDMAEFAARKRFEKGKSSPAEDSGI